MSHCQPGRRFVRRMKKIWVTYNCDGREVGQPVERVREFLDLGTRNANRFHDLELVR